MSDYIPSSVTVRSNRKRAGGSTISGPDLLPDQGQATPSTQRSKPSRPSIGHQPFTPSRGEMPPPRPASRASRSSYLPGHSRPGSRASISGLRAPLGNGTGPNFAPNASTDRVRPKSSLSNHGYDGVMDGDNDENLEIATPTPRRTTIGRRTSDIGSAIPSPIKRPSFGGASKLPAPAARRQSLGLGKTAENAGEMRPPSRMVGSGLNDVQEGYDMNETF